MSASELRRLPTEQVESVVKALYADADRLGWEHLAPAMRTAQYDKWVTSDEIGGVLTSFMTSENARSWIKDGPMKEYSRAVQGAGRYARFGSAHGPSALQIAVHALGASAAVIDGTLGVKPFHCLVNTTEGNPRTYVAWGSAKNFRHLVWACLVHLADNPGDDATVVVTETMADPTTAATKSRHLAIADRGSLGLKYFRTSAPRRASDREPLK